MRRGVAVLAAALMVGMPLAGCGGDDDGGAVRDLSEGGGTSTSTAGKATTSSAGGASPQGCRVEGGVPTKGADLVTTLTEFKIEPAAGTVPPGIVSFVAENAGAEPHELVVIKGADPKALPTDPATGAVNDEPLEEDGTFVGEIEPFAAGQLCRGNFTLEAGPYILLCNIVETEADGTKESHYVEGMVTTITVG